MIKKYALIALQKAINHALSLDESMPTKLAEIGERTLKIIITPLNVTFYIQFTEYGIVLWDVYKGIVDTTIQSSPIGLIRLSILPASKVRSLFNDDIKISGDVELGQQVKQFFDQIDIDWEGHLAQFTGDAIAYQLGSFVRNGMAFTQRVDKSLRKNLTGYLQEELRAFPSQEEVNDFFNDVDELTLQVERLEAHVNQLTGLS
jgi:ubiquinone biosynthesis protein UbiJ